MMFENIREIKGKIHLVPDGTDRHSLDLRGVTLTSKHRSFLTKIPTIMKASNAALSLILSLTSVAAFAPSPSTCRSLARLVASSSSSVTLRMGDDKVFDQEAFIAESKGASIHSLID
jgi:hypothetical protein